MDPKLKAAIDAMNSAGQVAQRAVRPEGCTPCTALSITDVLKLAARAVGELPSQVAAEAKDSLLMAYYECTDVTLKYWGSTCGPVRAKYAAIGIAKAGLILRTWISESNDPSLQAGVDSLNDATAWSRDWCAKLEAEAV